MYKLSHVNKALKKPAPERIPLSMPRSLDNDFYEIYIKFKSLDWKLLCRTKEKGGYSGILWQGRNRGHDCTILNSTFEKIKFSVEITHHYKGYQFKYGNLESFLFSWYSKNYKLAVIYDLITQRIYNRKTLFRSHRMEILKDLVENTINEPQYSTSSLELGKEIYTHRWQFHPKKNEYQSHLSLILDSLVETGDLKKSDRRYSVTGKAIATLADYEHDQQKHQDNFNNAKTTNSLTKALILVGILGIMAQLLMWYYDK